MHRYAYSDRGVCASAGRQRGSVSVCPSQPVIGLSPSECELNFTPPHVNTRMYARLMGGHHVAELLTMTGTSGYLLPSPPTFFKVRVSEPRAGEMSTDNCSSVQRLTVHRLPRTLEAKFDSASAADPQDLEAHQHARLLALRTLILAATPQSAKAGRIEHRDNHVRWASPAVAVAVSVSVSVLLS